MLTDAQPYLSWDYQIPNVALEEMGPSFDLVIRRTSFAASDMWKAAIKKPKV